MTYLYLCEVHGEFEADQKISDSPLEKCPHCLQEKGVEVNVKRLIGSSGGFILTGSGWGKDNYS